MPPARHEPVHAAAVGRLRIGAHDLMVKGGEMRAFGAAWSAAPILQLNYGLGGAAPAVAGAEDSEKPVVRQSMLSQVPQI